MATRRSAVAVPNVKKTVGDYLSEFQQQIGNSFCADCLAKSPQWIAFPHGVIICDNCAGAHRSLGSHVSQVKSIVYDKWTMKMYHELEKCGGNTEINSKLAKYCQYYEQPNPSSTADEREKFIKNKYELKIYTQPRQTNDKEEAAKRLAHYFLIVSKNSMLLPEVPKTEQEQKKKLRNFLIPESIFDVEFDATLNYRYPQTDYPSIELAARIFDFIFPEPLKVSDKMNLPEKRAFVLTDAEGAKQYGVSLVFWERISPMDILTMCETLNKFRKEWGHNEITSMPGAVYAPKAISLISHWPFFDQFSLFLQTLYRITKTPSAPIPIERYVMNFMHEVPVPPLGKTSVQFVVGDVSITLRRAPPNSLPYIYVQALNVFKCLSIGNVLTVFNAILQEHKMVLISAHLHLLLEVAETLTMLLFPFQLQGVYMPLLPSKLLDFLHSPVPFLAGVHPSWIKGQHYDDVVFVYLDDDQILTTSNAQLEALPKRPREKLEKRLEELLPWLHKQSPQKEASKKPKHKISMNYGFGNEEKFEHAADFDANGAITKQMVHHLDLLPISNFLTSGSTIQSQSDDLSAKYKKKSMENNEEQIFREIQKAFLKFFTSILENYANKYTEKQRKNDPELKNKEYVFFRENRALNQFEFEKEKFLKEGIDTSFRPFMEKLAGTQIFAAFCQEREELLESKTKQVPFEIRYFDEELIAKKNRSTLRTKKQPTEFLDDHSMDLKSVFVANPPNLNDLVATEYSYSSFPNQLKKARFGAVRQVNAPWNTQYDESMMQRTKSQRLRHHKNEPTFAALQQLLAMQHTAHINKAKSWDNFTENVLIVQRFVRMVISRKASQHQRDSIVRLQRHIRVYTATRHEHLQFNALRTAAVTLQSVCKTYLMVQRNKNNVYYQSTTTLQAVFRAYLHQKQFQKLYDSTTVLQALCRTHLRRKELARKMRSVQICQAYIKTAYLRHKHIATMTSIMRCQAVLRGTLLRNQQKKVLRMQLSKIRKQILELWQKTFTAYMYRAKFWIVYEQPSYLNLAIHNEELDRLHNVVHRLSTNKLALHEAQSRFEAERVELRRLLKEELQPNIRESLYTSWGINVKSKNKKDKLLNELFLSSSNPKQSATALLTICSSHSASILDVTSQVELRRADRIRDNLLLTVFSSLSSMQSLNRSLQKQQKYNRKQQLTIRTLNDELSHKQAVIIKQRTALNQLLHDGNNTAISPDYSFGNHYYTQSRNSLRLGLGVGHHSVHGHAKNTSSLGRLQLDKPRRFSEIGLRTEIRASSDDEAYAVNASSSTNDLQMQDTIVFAASSSNKNKKRHAQSHNTAAFHSHSRKQKKQREKEKERDINAYDHEEQLNDDEHDGDHD